MSSLVFPVFQGALHGDQQPHVDPSSTFAHVQSTNIQPPSRDVRKRTLDEDEHHDRVFKSNTRNLQKERQLEPIGKCVAPTLCALKHREKTLKRKAILHAVVKFIHRPAVNGIQSYQGNECYIKLCMPAPKIRASKAYGHGELAAIRGAMNVMSKPASLTSGRKILPCPKSSQLRIGRHIVKDLESKFSSSEAANAEKENLIKELREDIKLKASKITALTASDAITAAAMQHLQSQLVSQKSTIAATHKKIDKTIRLQSSALQQQRSQIRKQKHQVQALASQLDAEVRDNGEVAHMYVRKWIELEDKTCRQLAKEQAKLVEKRSELLVEFREKKERLGKEGESLRDELKGLRSEKREWEMEKDELEKRLKEQEQQVACCEDAHAAEIEELKKRLAEVEKASLLLQKDKAASEEKVTALTTEIDALKQELEQSNATLAFVKEDSEKERHMTSSKIEGLEGQLAETEAAAAVASMVAEVNQLDLEVELEQLRIALLDLKEDRSKASKACAPDAGEPEAQEVAEAGGDEGQKPESKEHIQGDIPVEETAM